VANAIFLEIRLGRPDAITLTLLGFSILDGIYLMIEGRGRICLA